MGIVVSAAYAFLGNGGRKIRRLSNGWIVSSIYKNVSPYQIQLYVSKDNGATFTLLGYLGGTTLQWQDFSIATEGTNVHVLGAYNDSLMYAKFDATTANGGAVANMPGAIAKYIDTNQSAINSTAIEIDPNNGTIHATWSSKNSTYGNYSFNIRYAQSIDGGTTWGTIEHVTMFNGTGVTGLQEVSMTLRNGTPVIVARGVGVWWALMNGYYSRNYGTNGSSINVFVRDRSQFPMDESTNNYSEIGKAWSGKSIFSHNDSPTLRQFAPSIITDKNGTLHLAWRGYTKTNTSREQILYTTSTDRGLTWSTVVQLTNETASQGNPSLTIDKNGKLFLFFGGAAGATLLNRYMKNENGVWSGIMNLEGITNEYSSVMTLYDNKFSGEFGDLPPTVYVQTNPNQVVYTGAYITNVVPIVNLTAPTNNQTLYENDVFNITGTASDADTGNTVTIRYQINALTTRAIKAFLSDGTTLESFSKSLTFKGGNLYDGTTLIAENLKDGLVHTLKVWATDDQGGTSVIKEIPFFVVPNRAPLLTVSSPVINGIIDSDKFTISGAFADSDGNATVVSYRINGSASVQVAEGASGQFAFDVSFGQLVIGANQIVIDAVDSYGAKVSKTMKLNKTAVETRLLKSTVRYKINPPTGSAQAVLLWIQRDENLDIDVSLSMTMQGEAESFVAVAASNTAPVDQTIVEDEFYHEAGSPKDNIIVQIDMTRSSIEVSDKIHLISGVLE